MRKNKYRVANIYMSIIFLIVLLIFIIGGFTACSSGNIGDGIALTFLAIVASIVWFFVSLSFSVSAGALDSEIRAEAEKKNKEAKIIEQEAEMAKREERRQKAKITSDLAYFNLIDSLDKCAVSISEQPIKRLNVNEIPEFTPTPLRKNFSLSTFSDFIVVDVETTGLSAKTNKLLEVSVIRFQDFEATEYMTTLINPDSKITERIAEINGISDNMVKDSPEIFDVAQSFIDFIGSEKVIVGHNLEFDLKFLYANGINLFEIKRRFCDTLYIASKTLKKAKPDSYDSYEYDVKNYKLSTLRQYYNIAEPPQEHRGIWDALVTGLVFKNMIEDEYGDNEE